MAVELHVIVETEPYVGVDQPGVLTFESSDVIAAGQHVLRALAETAPAGCAVVAEHAQAGSVSIPRVRDHSLGRARADIGHQWQWGLNSGYPRGLVHSASLFAPLTKHDRYDDQHQVVVTLWDLRAWLEPESIPAEWVTWQRAMLKRAVKFADAFVVPSHALAAQLEEIAPVRDRIRVVPVGVGGAFSPRALRVAPESLAVVVAASEEQTVAAVRAALAQGLSVQVLDSPNSTGLEAQLADVGLDMSAITVSGFLPDDERTGLLHRAAVLVNTANSPVWPWRVAEALQVGVPIVSLASAGVQDLVADAAIITPLESLSDAIAAAAGPESRRLRVLAIDRSASFSWRSAAEQLWALHADL